VQTSNDSTGATGVYAVTGSPLTLSGHGTLDGTFTGFDLYYRIAWTVTGIDAKFSVTGNPVVVDAVSNVDTRWAIALFTHTSNVDASASKQRIDQTDSTSPFTDNDFLFVGEDKNGNGALDSGEDANGNGQLDL